MTLRHLEIQSAQIGSSVGEKPGLAPISHQISEHIAHLLSQIVSQQGRDSVHATRTCPAGRQDVVTGCASCQRDGEKWGLECPPEKEMFSDSTVIAQESYEEALKKTLIKK